MRETTDRLPMLTCVGLFIGISLLIGLLFVGFGHLWPDVDIPSSIGTVTSMVAAMQAGMLAARRTKRLPTRREKLAFAAWSTAAIFALFFGVFWAVFAYYGFPFTRMTFMTAFFGELPNATLISALPWILLIAVVVSMLVIYFGFGFGAKSQLKALERKVSNVA